MDHLAFLRQYVGHAPLLMVGTTVLIVDGNDRLLLLLRTDNDCWGPPGGAVEPGEELERTARREVQEETGLELGELSLFGVYSGPELFYRYPNGDEVYNVTIAYLARSFHNEILLNEEHTEWRWFPYAGIPAAISPPILPVIRQFLARVQGSAEEHA